MRQPLLGVCVNDNVSSITDRETETLERGIYILYRLLPRGRERGSGKGDSSLVGWLGWHGWFNCPLKSYEKCKTQAWRRPAQVTPPRRSLLRRLLVTSLVVCKPFSCRGRS